MLAGQTPGDDLVVRGARVLDPVEGIDTTLDVRIDGGTIAQIGEHLDANGHRVIDGAGLDARARLHRPACAPANAGPRGRGDDRDRHRSRRSRRVLRDPRDPEHRPGRRRPRRAARPARPRRATRRMSRSASWPRSRRARTGRADRDGRARRRRRRRVHRRRPSGRRGRRHAPRAPVQRDHRPHDRRALRRADADARRPRARGRGRGRARARRLAVAGREPDGRPRCRPRRRHRPAGAPDAPLGARVGRASTARAGARRPRVGEATPHHLVPDRRGGPLARPEREDEPAAAHRGRSRRADRRCSRRHDRGDRDRPRAALAARRRTCRSRPRRSASSASRPPSRRSTPTSSSRACSPLETLLERMSAGPAAIFGLDRPRIAVGAPANLTLLDLAATWRVTQGLPLPLDELLAARPAADEPGDR